MRRCRAIVIALLVAAGCKKKDDDTTTPAAGTGGADGSSESGGAESRGEEAGPLTVSVRSEALTNHGRPLYLVVRAVTLEGFVEDRYQDVANLVVAPDETVLHSELVFPGIDDAFEIPAFDAKTVGVYCLFSDATGTSWKRFYEEPESIEVVLGRDRLEPEP